MLEIAPSGAAGIDERGHAGAEAEPVGIHHLVVGAESLAECGSIHVRMDVNEARGDVQSRDVHRFARARGRDVLGDGGDFPALDGHVADGVDPVLGVEDVTALQEKVVLLREGGAREQEGEADGQVRPKHDFKSILLAARATRVKLTQESATLMQE